MDVSLSIPRRLVELGLTPPAPGRTDIYDKIGFVLGLAAGELAKLAEAQRQLELKKVSRRQPPSPLFEHCRDLILRKCQPAAVAEVRRIFEKEPFGEFERLVTQKILDAAQKVAAEELRSEEWLRSMAQLSSRSFEQMRVEVLEFLDTDVFQISMDG